MNKIPLLLIWSRLVFAFLILLLSYYPVPHNRAIAVLLFSIGLLSDVFDGIIARKLGVSSVLLRRMDSIVDQVFWIAVAAAAFIQCPSFFSSHAVSIGVLVVLEVATYGVSFLRFGKEVATHSWGAKLWVLTLFAALTEIMLSCRSGLLYDICFYTGLVTRAETIGILLLLRKWTNDVPTLYHALLLRQGKPIKRHKLLNG